jgi:hypothetical protein
VAALLIAVSKGEPVGVDSSAIVAWLGLGDSLDTPQSRIGAQGTFESGILEREFLLDKWEP